MFVFAWFLSGCFAGEGLGVHFSPFTHSLLYFVHDMSEALYPGLSSLELEGDCVAVP